jgi:hypothetical protein
MILPVNDPKSQIKRTLDLLHPNGLVEVRALHLQGRSNYTAAGYFNDFAGTAAAVLKLEQQHKPSGIYFNLNSINPALLARSPDQITHYASCTTSDRDVIWRRWLLIDVDPARPSGVPSSDDELEAAKIVAQQARDWLMNERGFDEPVEAMSGNGWHLLFQIDMPNDDESTETVKGILNAVADRFGGENTPYGLSRVDVDRSVFNAARITKLYGTLARKGHTIPGRPIRCSYIASVPTAMEMAGGLS